jgi:chaperone BCS1
LAGHLDYNICILNLNERGLTDDRLNHMLNQLPPRSFVLLEDVDAAFNQRNNTTAAKEYSVTFSGLLNTLDGVASTEERIVFMTTNHPECLDPALIRPGRVDKKVEISYVTPDQVYAMFTKFYPEDSASDVNMGALATEFVAAVTSTLEEHQMTLSGAELQGLFMYYKDQPHRALEDLPKRLVAEKLAYQEALAAAQAQQLQQQKEFPQM